VTAHRRRRICPPKRVVPPQSLRLISLTLRHTSLGPRRRHSTQQDAAWTFANLSKSPKPDCPAACFENFTNKWHKPYLQSPSIEAEKGINTRTESNTTRLAEEIENEAANWFMEFRITRKLRIKLKNPSTFITLILLSAFSLKSNVFLV
ncbi:unnamed protein product, partial [Brassica oleracea]